MEFTLVCANSSRSLAGPLDGAMLLEVLNCVWPVFFVFFFFYRQVF